MLSDTITILQKELKEFFVQRGSIRGGLTNLLIVIAIGGVLFPLQFGREWVTGPLGLITASWLPLLMSMGLVADAFAGERERHTLETLLASRLSDQVILFGKMAASVVYGLGIGVMCMLVGVVVVNLSIPGAGFYPFAYFLGAIIFNLLGMILVTAIGVLVSLHASTVRQAYQRMSIGMMALWLPLILGPQFLPESFLQQVGEFFNQINGVQAAVIVTAALVIIDAALITAAQMNFKRARLILD